MAVYTLIIANKNTSGKRKMEGDIIAVCPDGHAGGRSTRKNHLLVRIELPDIAFDRVRRLQIPQYGGNILAYPDLESNAVAVVAKRRFQVPLAALVSAAAAKGITLDLAKVQDDTLDYQPLEGVVFTALDLIGDKVSGLKLNASRLRALRDA